MLVSASVHDKFEKLFADAVKIQQRTALGRSAVGRDAFAVLLEFVQEIEEGLFDFEDLVCKAFVVTK